MRTRIDSGLSSSHWIKPLPQRSQVPSLCGGLAVRWNTALHFEQVRRPLETLSGGEWTRLQLLLLMLEGANCLLLDEPTNHLDIEAVEQLEQALESYTGTLLLVTHDLQIAGQLQRTVVLSEINRPKV